MPLSVPTQNGSYQTLTPAQARALAGLPAQTAPGAEYPLAATNAINGTSLPGAVTGDNWFDGPIWRGFLWTPTYPQGHSGNDIGMPIGTPLTALLPGKVISLGMEPWGGQINLQSSYPGIGPIVVSYLHLTSFARGMGAGADVQPGELIGYSGQPPPGGIYGSGAHCHFEVNTGYQPPYMGHQGPPSPIDSMFLIQAARNGTLGQVGSGTSGIAGTTTDAAMAPNIIGNFATWLGLPSFSLGTGAITRAPLSPGFLGVVEGIDETMEIPSFDNDNILGWLGATGEAWLARWVVVLLGSIIILICMWNAARPMLQAEQQVASPLLAAAASGAL